MTDATMAETIMHMTMQLHIGRHVRSVGWADVSNSWARRRRVTGFGATRSALHAAESRFTNCCPIQLTERFIGEVSVVIIG